MEQTAETAAQLTQRRCAYYGAFLYGGSAMVMTLICFGLTCLIFPVPFTQFMAKPGNAQKVLASILASVPGAAIVGAASALVTYRQAVERKILFARLCWVWYMPFFLYVGDVSGAVLFVILFVMYSVRRKDVLAGKFSGLPFSLVAASFVPAMFVLSMNQSLGGFRDKLATCSYSSLWFSDVLLVSSMSRWREQSRLARVPPALQFSLSGMLVWVLICGSYVSLLVKLFVRK